MRMGSWYVFCDICGKRCLNTETTKLSAYTGRGGLIVCKEDADEIDYGLIPYNPRSGRITSFARINHTDTTNGAEVYDFEGGNFTILSTSQGDYLSTGQGDLIIL